MVRCSEQGVQRSASLNDWHFLNCLKEKKIAQHNRSYLKATKPKVVVLSQLSCFTFRYWDPCTGENCHSFFSVQKTKCLGCSLL